MIGSKIKLELNTGHFEELVKKGYSLDMIFLLMLIGTTDEAYPNSPKVDNIIQTMKRKGLLSEKEELTDEGGKLLSFLSSKEERPKIPRKKRVVVDEVFDKWWKAYPPTDTFEYNNKKFKGTRALRVKKDECKAKIHKILAEGEYTIEQLIDAVKLEVQQKVENSYKTGQNKMSYFQNSLTYLNQCTYEPFIELLKAGHKIVDQTKSVSSGGVEI